MIKLAIIGTGAMAHTHVKMLKPIEGCEIIAVYDIDAKKSKLFAKQHKILHVAKSIEDLPTLGVNAACNVTPDSQHHAVTMKIIELDIHVLCEKPLADNVKEAEAMAHAANAKGLIHMVNFNYRNYPVIQKAQKMIQNGDIGRIIHFEASYLQSWLPSQAWGDWKTNPSLLWKLSKEHGSKGVLGDIGVHIFDILSFCAGRITSIYCLLATFKKEQVEGYTFDANDSATINATLNCGAMGCIHLTRWASGQNSIALNLYGDKGSIRIRLDKSTDQFRLCNGENIHIYNWETVEAPAVPHNWERFISAIQTKRPTQPDFYQGARIQKVLDTCFLSSESDKRLSV